MAQVKVKKLVSRVRWMLMSDRKRYQLLWARTRANWN
jgi:hypothetical protein